MTPKEAYEAGYPGTYMGDDGNGGPSGYFPAPLCIQCIGNIHEHPGCVLEYWRLQGNGLDDPII